MAKSGKLLRQAHVLHREKRAQWEASLQARREEVFGKIPRLREIDFALRDSVQALVSAALGGNFNLEARINSIEEKNLALQKEAEILLLQAGYPANYLDPAPLCTLCDDTGYRDTARCSCLLDIYNTLQAQELSKLLDLGQENFDAFSLEYYDDRNIHPGFGITARQNMEINYSLCQDYARNFTPRSGNLLLMGGPGLGKTFLSSCIAKTVSEAGFSVVYDTSASLFSRFEEERFRRGEDPETAQEEVERYLNCDLLILDDLGTEMVTSFVISTLYTLLNTRLLRKKQTVISSNFSLDDLGAKYTPRIMSRLEGEYARLTFFGEDIRKLKRDLTT